MADEQKYLEDIVTELSGIGDGVNEIPKALETLIEQDSNRKYFDDSLGFIIKESVEQVLTKISVSDAGKNYYYGEVVDLVKNAFSEVIGKLGNPTIDMSPIMKIAADISKQNQSVILAISSMSNSVGDKNYSELFLMIVKMIESNNEFIKASMNQKDYMNKMEELISAVNKKPESWEFKHIVRNGRIESSAAVAKYKA